MLEEEVACFAPTVLFGCAKLLTFLLLPCLRLSSVRYVVSDYGCL